MTNKLFGLGLALVAFTGSAVAAPAVESEMNAQRGMFKTFPGFVAHGINTYNGGPIGDYSKVAPGVGMLNSPTAVLEIGALAAPGSFDSNQITPATGRSTPVATTRSFFDFFVPSGELDTNTVNVTLDKIGTSYFGFGAMDDRVSINEFDSYTGVPSIYRAKEAPATPTVGDWERIEGRMSVFEQRNGKSVVYFSVKKALPNSLYTLWDVGIKNPSTDQAGGYAVPLGGLPNTVRTDEKGCAFVRVEMPYSPARSCAAGESSCSAYISLFYHWDGQAYGGAPAATWAKAPTGIYAANQMVFPTSGDLIQEPATTLNPHQSFQCN